MPWETTSRSFNRPSEDQIAGNAFFHYKQPALLSSGSVIIFVHGLKGSPFGTWENFARLVFEDDELNIDVALFEYNTSIIRWSALRFQPARHVEDIAQELTDYVRDYLRDYKQIFFVAHSFGGLVIKFALRQIIVGYPDNIASRITMLFLLGTPNYGTRWASIPSPLLFLVSPEIKCMRIFSPELLNLHNFWIGNVRNDPGENSSKFLVQERAVVSYLDRWVSKGSGVGNLPNRYRLMTRTSHTGLAHPASRTDRVYDYLKSHLRGSLSMVEIGSSSGVGIGDRNRFPEELQNKVTDFFFRMNRMAELHHNKEKLQQEKKYQHGDAFDQVYDQTHKEVTHLFMQVRTLIQQARVLFHSEAVRKSIGEFIDWYHILAAQDQDIEISPSAPGQQHLQRILTAMAEELKMEQSK